MSLQSINNPTKEEVYRAYVDQGNHEHWERIQRLVLTGGFGVEPNPHNSDSQGEKLGQQMPDFRVTWPTLELEAQDHQIFFKACQMVMGTVHLDDETYSKSTLPKIFKVLARSYLFTQLFKKESSSQNNTVQHHVETVPTLIQTSQINNRDRFILRITAVFHDVGKAFDIGRDQVHYHALIGSNIVSWFMEEYADQFIDRLHLSDMRVSDPVLLKKKHGKQITKEDVRKEYSVVKNQIVEMIRLHHVLEQLDKKVLDLDIVAQIFADKHVNPLIFGLFAIADGASVVPDNERYAEFLIKNLDALAKLVDLMEYEEILQDGRLSDEVKQMFAQSLQCVIREVVERIADLPEKVQKIIREISGKIDVILATALLSLSIQKADV